MRRAVLALLLLFALMGCESKQGEVDGRYEPVVVDTKNGEVHCVVFDAASGGGSIDCNWDLANKLNETTSQPQRWQEPYGGCEEAYRYPKSEGYALCKEKGLVP